MSGVIDTAADAVPVVRTTLLGGGKLSLALQHGAASADWVTKVSGADAWRAQIDAVQKNFADIDWASRLAPAFAATGAAAERLARAAAGGFVITTGQQPGLFGGPAYTWSKAISALALADELEAQFGVAVLPVFWAATDDADWREAAVTYVLGESGLETLSLVGEVTDGIAMSEVALGNLDSAFAHLRRAAGSAANSEYLGLVERAYVQHATVGDSYVQLLRGVLEPLGIAVLDASHGAFKQAADPMLRRALQQSGAVNEAIEARNSAIRDAGFTPQVESVQGLSQVFRTTRSARGNTRERVSIASAARVAREADTGSLGANVLLRPVVERALLPTLAYVAGPGEYAYFAQVGAIATALSVAAPVAVPRWSGSVLEPQIMRLLQRYDVSESDFLDPHEVETRIARSAVDETVSDALDRMRVATETQMRALGVALDSSEDLLPASVVEGTTRHVMHRLDRLERRIVASVKRRDTTRARDLAVLRAAIRPLGKPPERVLNLLPVLARYGPSVLELMRAEARVHARTLVQGAETRLP